MSRTTLCVVTSTGLAFGSLGIMITRYCALGDEVLAPKGPGTWHVTLLVNGVSTYAMNLFAVRNFRINPPTLAIRIGGKCHGANGRRFLREHFGSPTSFTVS